MLRETASVQQTTYLIERSCSFRAPAIERSSNLKPRQRCRSRDVCGVTKHKDDAIRAGIGWLQPSKDRLRVLSSFALIRYFRAGLTFVFAFALALGTYESHRLPRKSHTIVRGFHWAKMIASTSASDLPTNNTRLKNQETVTGPQCDFRSALLISIPFYLHCLLSGSLIKEGISLGPGRCELPSV